MSTPNYLYIFFIIWALWADWHFASSQYNKIGACLWSVKFQFWPFNGKTFRHPCCGEFNPSKLCKVSLNFDVFLRGVREQSGGMLLTWMYEESWHGEATRPCWKFPCRRKKAFPLENKDAASTFNSTSPEEENNYLYEFLIGCKLSQSLEKLFQMCNIISL